MKEIMDGLNTLIDKDFEMLAYEYDAHALKGTLVNAKAPLPRPMPSMEGKTRFFKLTIYADRGNHPKYPLKVRLDGIKVADGMYSRAYGIYPIESIEGLADVIKWMGELNS